MYINFPLIYFGKEKGWKIASPYVDTFVRGLFSQVLRWLTYWTIKFFRTRTNIISILVDYYIIIFKIDDIIHKIPRIKSGGRKSFYYLDSIWM